MTDQARIEAELDRRIALLASCGYGVGEDGDAAARLEAVSDRQSQLAVVRDTIPCSKACCAGEDG